MCLVRVFTLVRGEADGAGTRGWQSIRCMLLSWDKITGKICIFAFYNKVGNHKLKHLKSGTLCNMYVPMYNDCMDGWIGGWMDG